MTGFGANPLKRLDRRQDRRDEAGMAAGLEVDKELGVAREANQVASDAKH